MIAGCLAQARQILQYYDEILYGPPPEQLVEQTHRSIADILRSEEAFSLFRHPEVNDEDEEDSVSARDLLIKKLVEAVSPIIPLTIRNKSLDGSYFRTALHLLGATELMFSQYEAHIRAQANPAGLVGMCNAMHADIKGATVHGTEMKSPSEFMREMKSQYNTSLGLGESFRNDMTPRDKRRGRGSRNNRGRAWRFSDRYNENTTGTQRSFQPLTSNNEPANFGQNNRSQVAPLSSRGRNDCYAFLAGTCRRGGNCRFRHGNS